MLIQLTALLVFGLFPSGTVDDLRKGAVVRLSLGEKESIIGEVLESNDDSVTCLDLETLEPVEISRSEIKAVREDVTDALIFQRAGVGRWLGWQLSKQFEDASQPQTIASIQQASIFITANRSSGLMVGDEVYAYRIGEPVKDPSTGEILDTPEQKIAQLEVLEVSEKIVTCRPKGEFSIELRVGDVVRPAMPRSSVAILPFSNPNGKLTKSGVLFCGQVTDALTTLGVETLERERLVSVLKEQLFQLNVSGDEAARIGKLLGASTLVTGSISAMPSDPKSSIVTVRLLDVRTGQVIKTLDAEIPTKDLDNGIVERTSDFNSGQSVDSVPIAGIRPFKPGNRTVKFQVPSNASKIEISFSNLSRSGSGPEHVGGRGIGPGNKGRVVINGTEVLRYTGRRTIQFRGREERIGTYKLFDGAEGDVRRSINVTPLIKLGEENVLTYSHDEDSARGVRVWITR